MANSRSWKLSGQSQGCNGLMRPVVLLGVVGDGAVVHTLQLDSHAGLGEVAIAETQLNPKMRFDGRLPGLAAFNRGVHNAECGVDGVETVGPLSLHDGVTARRPRPSVADPALRRWQPGRVAG